MVVTLHHQQRLLLCLRLRKCQMWQWQVVRPARMALWCPLIRMWTWWAVQARQRRAPCPLLLLLLLLLPLLQPPPQPPGECLRKLCAHTCVCAHACRGWAGMDLETSQCIA